MLVGRRRSYEVLGTEPGRWDFSSFFHYICNVSWEFTRRGEAKMVLTHVESPVPGGPSEVRDDEFKHCISRTSLDQEPFLNGNGPLIVAPLFLLLLFLLCVSAWGLARLQSMGRSRRSTSFEGEIGGLHQHDIRSRRSTYTKVDVPSHVPARSQSSPSSEVKIDFLLTKSTVSLPPRPMRHRYLRARHMFLSRLSRYISEETCQL